MQLSVLSSSKPGTEHSHVRFGPSLFSVSDLLDRTRNIVMQRLVAILLSLAAMTSLSVAAQSSPPDWAYAIPPPAVAPQVRDDGKLLSLPGSDRHFTRSKINGYRDKDTVERVAPADWYPRDHPHMPKIVAEGDNTRGIVACALCHLPNGRGRPENADLAGLPAEYIVQQLQDMRGGLRQSAEPRKANAKLMYGFAAAMTDQEMHEAAAYFSSIPRMPWVKVVETGTVPKTTSHGGMWIPLEGPLAGTEPIGDRIIETPMNVEHAEILRDPRSGFIAYVPIGAVAKGKTLVTTGGSGKTLACAICHGADLGGIGPIPGIAARSPSYIARQLYDIEQGARHGGITDLMKPVVAKLSKADILDITAYVSSRPVPGSSATRSR